VANQQGLIHPDLLSRLQPYHYAGSCTIQQATEAVDSYGAPTTSSWANLTGHVALPCRVAPDNRARQEVRETAAPYVLYGFTIVLAGHYPTISEKMRAIVGSQTHNIQAVEHDGQGKTTRLRTQIVQ
jgi:hypothetical protein